MGPLGFLISKNPGITPGFVSSCYPGLLIIKSGLLKRINP